MICRSAWSKGKTGVPWSSRCPTSRDDWRREALSSREWYVILIFVVYYDSLFVFL